MICGVTARSCTSINHMIWRDCPLKFVMIHDIRMFPHAQKAWMKERDRLAIWEYYPVDIIWITVQQSRITNTAQLRFLVERSTAHLSHYSHYTLPCQLCTNISDTSVGFALKRLHSQHGWCHLRVSNGVFTQRMDSVVSFLAFKAMVL